ncbi:MAG: 30S ribosomal protein S20 [Planctomycetota bacterium]
MPNTASAKKRLRQNEKLRLHNRGIKSAMRSQIRSVREAVKAGDFEKAREGFRVASRHLDRAAARNVIHRNSAARTKSRLNALIKKAASA